MSVPREPGRRYHLDTDTAVNDAERVLNDPLPWRVLFYSVMGLFWGVLGPGANPAHEARKACECRPFCRWAVLGSNQ